MNIGDKATVPLNIDGVTVEVEGVVTDVNLTTGLAEVTISHNGCLRRACLPLKAQAARPAPTIPKEVEAELSLDDPVAVSLFDDPED